MRSAQLDGILGDDALRGELEARQSPGGKRPVFRAIVVRPGETTTIPSRPGRRARLPRAERPAPSIDEMLADTAGSEAVVLRFGRPSLLVRRNTFDVPTADTWKARLAPTKSKIDAAIRSVGRVEVVSLGIPFIGTAWIVAPGIAVTNRHVALEFALRGPHDEFAFRRTPTGETYAADLDFHEEAGSDTPFEVDFERVLYIAPDGQTEPDIAFLAVKPRGNRQLPRPIPLFDGKAVDGQVVVAIGYPAEDPRSDAADEHRIFGDVYNVKRVAPGLITGTLGHDVFTHDCTTLGGSSGSVILDVETGAALGLHFGGIYLKNNFALGAATVRAALGRAAKRPEISTISRPTAVPEAETVVKVADLADRTGYDSSFLAAAPAQRVPLPRMKAALQKAALRVAPSKTGLDRFALRYDHFSIVMHEQRRMAVFTAVNIDGSQEQRLKRTVDPWAKDPRIPTAAQIGGELYANNELDRGHLVRRLDPTWGPTASIAERDTFFFTNCTPQHAHFNQVLWAELEDYLLDNSQTYGFRACVFTGPIFTDSDGLYRGVRVPGSYWKVASMLRTEDQRLTSTGYVVSQADLLTDLEFAFGQVRTYQVSLKHIEALTGLDFGALKAADPLDSQEGIAVRELVSGGDITI